MQGHFQCCPAYDHHAVTCLPDHCDAAHYGAHSRGGEEEGERCGGRSPMHGRYYYTSGVRESDDAEGAVHGGDGAHAPGGVRGGLQLGRDHALLPFLVGVSGLLSPVFGDTWRA